MRPVQDTAGTPSATPIYDALFAEFRKAFRTLPGDRSGEEELGFTAFGTGPHGGGLYGSGLHGSGLQGSGLHGTGLLSTSSYNSGVRTRRPRTECGTSGSTRRGRCPRTRARPSRPSGSRWRGSTPPV
ncbi:hypothetical protein ACRJ4B_12635 [Streptomyces sp. GTA36]